MKKISKMLFFNPPLLCGFCVSCVTPTALHPTFMKNEISITVSSTIGNAFTFTPEKETITPGQKYRGQFLSSTYEVEEGLILPVHRQLKKTDVEVIRNNVNIIDHCSLVNDVLTIPGEYINDYDITINILGGEICEWITWEIIENIATQDEESDEEVMKKYFQVGDYKTIYSDHKYKGHVRLIDFYHDTYKKTIEGVVEEIPASTTWEMYDEPLLYSDWGCYEGPHDLEGYHSWPWSARLWEEPTKIWTECNNTNVMDGITEKKALKISGDNTIDLIRSENRYFLATYTEYTNGELDMYTRHHLSRSGKDGTMYAYYDTNQFHSIKTNQQRLIKSKGGPNDFYVTGTLLTRRTTAPSYHDRNLLIKAHTGEVHIDEDTETEASIGCAYPAYCLFIV